MLRPVIAGECALEFQCLRSFSPPPETTFQNFVESSAFVFVVLRPCGKRFALGLRSAEQGKLGHSFLWNELYSDTEPARPGGLLFDVMTLSEIHKSAAEATPTAVTAHQMRLGG